jgi:hypothetical protein
MDPFDTELQQYLGTAWGTARLLGATFSPECWADLAGTIRRDVAIPPPPTDTVAASLNAEQRVALAHSRVMRLVNLMFEEAISQQASPSQPGTPVRVELHEWTLTAALLRLKICLWPFWTSGC